MKIKNLVYYAFAVMLMFPSEGHAQFLKKVGKALKDVDNTLKEVNDILGSKETSSVKTENDFIEVSEEAFIGESVSARGETLESAALMSATARQSDNEIQSLDNHMKELLAKAEQIQSELKNEVDSVNDGENDLNCGHCYSILSVVKIKKWAQWPCHR